MLKIGYNEYEISDTGYIPDWVRSILYDIRKQNSGKFDSMSDNELLELLSKQIKLYGTLPNNLNGSKGVDQIDGRCCREIDKSKVKYAALLTLEQAQKIPISIRNRRRWWWLRTQGTVGIAQVMGVDCNGDIDTEGCHTACDGAVRPALVCDEIGTSRGEQVTVNGVRFICVGNNLLLMHDIEIDGIPYLNAYQGSADYETSDIKKYVDNWFRNL